MGDGPFARDDATADEPGDSVLFDRFRQGDAAAFEVLLRRHRRAVHQFILRYLRDPQQADDLFQDVFLRVVASADHFRGESKFSTWVFSIARNLCVDAARRASHRRHVSLDQSGGDGPALVERIASATRPADRQMLSRQIRVRVEEALAALPAEQREVFLLRETHHLQFGEIAAIVGAPENTVKSRMRYALERLQEALAEFQDHAKGLPRSVR